MEIEVTECVETEQGIREVKGVIDEKQFLKLYGEDDLKILLDAGAVGDVIGQGKWYRARILTSVTKQDFENVKLEYLKVKAEYDAVFKKVLEANKSINDAFENGQLSADEWAWKTTDNEFRFGLDIVQEKLVKAENKLIAVGRAYLEQKLTSEQLEAIKVIWECKFPTIREKLVNLLLRVD